MCQSNTEPLVRQHMGCGFLPRLALLEPGMIAPSVWQAPYDAAVEPWTTCPGYTTSLPDVIDVARCHLHTKMGTLRERTGGEPCQALLDGLEVFQNEIALFEQYAMRPKKDGDA